ncbi:hypothetical protein QJQ45_025196 [Haematococcus lacustris]|nr:hypothetical protein QJQ45_025196 [Haematococcus lacustris]
MLRLGVVAVVGESFLVPELMWASKDDELMWKWRLMWCIMPSYGCRRLRMGSSSSSSSSCSSKRTLMALGYYLASPISNAPVESLLQLLKHGGGRYMELPALLQLMSLRTCKEAMKTVDVHDLQQRMSQLRAEVRRKEDAAAAAQRSAKAERQITDAAHKVGRVVVIVGTTPELAVPAGAPPQQQQQLAAASTSRKREAPAANKPRAAKQGATHSSVAKRARAARLAWGEIA